MQTVLLCADDDVVALADPLRIARERGLELHVVVALQRDDGPLLEAMRRAGETLFVLVRSPTLDGPRAQRLQARFEDGCRPGQHMLTLRLPADPEHFVEEIEGKRARIGGSASRRVRSTLDGHLVSEELLDPGFTPLFLSGDLSQDPEATERHRVAAPHDDETLRARPVTGRHPPAAASRRSAARMAIGIALTATLGIAAYFGWRAFFERSPPPAADEIEARSADDPPIETEPVTVPSLSDEGPSPSSTRRVRRRATPRSGH
jgi:hypothetical protein